MRIFFSVLFAAAWIPSTVFSQYVPGVNNNIVLLGHLHEYGAYANVWGYADSKGNEYALLGADRGLSVINITDPRNPVELDFVPGPQALPYHWREIKTYSHYAYVVSEGTSPAQFSGIQVIDLSTLPDSVRYLRSVYWPGVSSTSARAHSISVDEAGYLYIQGGTATANTGGLSGGVRIFSLADPQRPQPVGFYNARYVHDSFVKNNLLFNSNIQDGGRVDILDISNRAQPRLLTSINYFRGANHNSGTTEDGQYLFTTDEATGRTLKVWDIRVLWDADPANDRNIDLVAEYIGNPTQIAHNVHIKGDYAYVAHYVEGVKILDIANPREPVEVGYYDTFPQPGTGFLGNWGVFPYFPSGNFVVSDMQTGLYVLQFNGARAGGVEGKVTDSQTEVSLAGVSVRFLEANKMQQTDGAGNYKLRANNGEHTIIFSKIGYLDETLHVNLPASAVNLRLDVTLRREGSVSVDDQELVPLEFALAQNRPNPFRGWTQIEYALTAPSEVELKIYTLQGQLVKTLVSGQQSVGRHTVQWNGTNEQNAPAANGVYLYALQTPSQKLTRKLILLH